MMVLRHNELKNWIFHYHYCRMEGHKVEFNLYVVLIAYGSIFSFFFFFFYKKNQVSFLLSNSYFYKLHFCAVPKETNLRFVCFQIFIIARFQVQWHE